MSDETVAKKPDTGKGDGAGGDGQQDKYVPIERLEEEIGKRQTLETQLAELKGKVDGLSTKSEAPKNEQPAREFTRSELSDAVERGKITRTEADAIWDDQQERRTSQKIETVKTEVKQELTETAKIGSMIQNYKELVPDLHNPASDPYQKVKAEFEYMVNELAMPKSEKTELAALRAVYGSIDTLKSKAKPKDNRPDPSNETASRGGGDGGTTDDGAPKDIDAKLKGHYQRMIDKGMYKGWDDDGLKEELKYVRSGRQKQKAA